MTDKRTEARDARLARYAELRDSGMLPVDAARETPVSSTTQMRYERWYRETRGLPRREPKVQPR